MRSFLLLTLVVSLGLGGCRGASELTIENARIGEPTGPNAALYFTASGGEADRLTAASTSVATGVHFHQTRIDADGTVAMLPVAEMALSGGSELVLEPGGLHLMLLDVDQSLTAGDEVQVVLTWANAGDIVVNATVVPPGETVIDGN